MERYKQSLLIIHSQIDHGGGILAANDTDISAFARDTYSYVWPRDGALVSSALMHAGHASAPERFLGFCARVVSPNGYLRHKYNPDGSLASTWHGYVRDGKPVLPIQEDETALVIWALGEYFDLYQRIEETAPFYRGLVTRPADFLLSHVDQTYRPAAPLVRPLGGALGRTHLHRGRRDRRAPGRGAAVEPSSARPSAQAATWPRPTHAGRCPRGPVE